MLHEGLGSVALWKHFPQRLASRTGCGVLVYSRYGHGGSDKLLEKRPVNSCITKVKWCCRSCSTSSASRGPFCWGTAMADRFRSSSRENIRSRVRALILEAPHVFVEDLSVASITQAKVNYQTTDLPQKLGRYHAHVDETFWGWNDIWLDPQFRSWNIEEYLPAIRCPILCIQGEEDEYGTIAQVEAIKAHVPATEIVMLPNCKHSPHRDQAEATLERMGGSWRRFRKKWSANRD